MRSERGRLEERIKGREARWIPEGQRNEGGVWDRKEGAEAGGGQRGRRDGVERLQCGDNGIGGGTIGSRGREGEREQRGFSGRGEEGP